MTTTGNNQNTSIRRDRLVEVMDIDVEIAIAEAIQLMPPNHPYEDKGVPVLQYLKKLGYIVMEDKGRD